MLWSGQGGTKFKELKRLEMCSTDNDELLYTLQVVAATLDEMKGEGE